MGLEDFLYEITAVHYQPGDRTDVAGTLHCQLKETGLLAFLPVSL